MDEPHVKKVMYRFARPATDDKPPATEQSGAEPDFLFFCPACRCGHAFWTVERNRCKAIWTFDGNMERPTFSPSLKITREIWTPPVTGENLAEWRKAPWKQTKVAHVCHLFVKAGRIEYCSDSSHEFAGKTVDMVPF